MQSPHVDFGRIREDFPILSRTIHGKPLVFLDNAATSQKPKTVIDATSDFYSQANANIHRGLYSLSEQATVAYENARKKVQAFLNAQKAEEIIFLRGTTEAVNLVSTAFGEKFLHAGDEVILSQMEHHSNIVPWQILREKKGIVLKIIPITDDGELRLEEFERLFSPKTKLVSVVHVSNTLGTINPVKEIASIAHRHGVPVLIDGAQSSPHLKIDVQDIGCDFFAFSGHKLYGPTGIGALYVKEEILSRMNPYQGGGDMILQVSFGKTLYAKPPQMFEAGTANIAGAIGLGVALDYVGEIGIGNIERHERELLTYATQRLEVIPGLRIIGNAREKASIISFVLDGIHPHDIGSILDKEGICVRAGHHCTQPLMERFGVPATARASFAFYNTKAEIDKLAEGIHLVQEIFA